jgi:hypothetical protein
MTQLSPRDRLDFELDDATKAQGRRLRDALQAALDAEIAATAPRYQPPAYLAIMRHSCPAHGDRSTALQLIERYEVVTDPEAGDEPTEFVWITKRGRCRSCGAEAITPEGVFELGWRRPPR